MKIRILVCLAGADFVLRPGDVTTTERGEAERLIAAGFAESVELASDVTAESVTDGTVVAEKPAKRGKK